MCGIFGYIGKSDQAPNLTFSGLKDIEYRGYDSWGIAFWKLDDQKWKIEKEVGFLPSSLKLPSSNLSIGHTRWATHGGVTKANAHPHSDCDDKIVIVHNGIVENYLELKSELKNHHFKSETDSEVIVHHIEQSYKKNPDLVQAVASIFNKLKGLNAIVVSDGVQIVVAKIGSPLVVGKTEDGFVVASDPNALLPLTKNFLFLEDGQLVSLQNKIQLYSVKNLTPVEPKFTKVTWDHASSVLKNYPHFMLKEIDEQPKVITNLAQNSKEVEKIAKLIKSAYGTYFIGCGTASYACLAGVYLFSKIAKKHVNFSVGSEFNYIEDYLTDKSLLIAVSQSGESIDVVEPVTSAKKKGTKIVSLVNVLGSSLYRMSDHPVMLQAGVEKAVASTKAMIAMISCMILLAYSIKDETKEAEKILNLSAKEIEKILLRKNDIKSLANKIHKQKNMYILGRGLSYPVALESALKIKECSYLHAEGFAGGELKHGVMALIQKGTPVIVFAPNDETKSGVLANAMEVKARGAYVIGISDENNPVFDYYFNVTDTGASSIIPNIVFSQLLAYYLSVKLGLNPDKPRNLAKSVVVR